MPTLQTIFTEITELTGNIETNYPELYRTLDENPMTIVSSAHVDINVQVMEDYLNSLKQLLKHHMQLHKKL